MRRAQCSAGQRPRWRHHGCTRYAYLRLLAPACAWTAAACLPRRLTYAAYPLTPHPLKNAQNVLDKCCRNARRSSRKKTRKLLAKLLPAAWAMTRNPDNSSNECSSKTRVVRLSSFRALAANVDDFGPSVDRGVRATSGQCLATSVQLAKPWPEVIDVCRRRPKLLQQNLRALFEHCSNMLPGSVPRPIRRGAIWRASFVFFF